MSQDDLGQSAPFTGISVDERVTVFLRAVYGWMCAGLAITAGTAWFVASSPSLVTAIATNRGLFWILIIAQFGIVLLLSARVQKLSASAASGLFVVYSALTGVTLSFVLLAVHRGVGGEHVSHHRGDVRRDGAVRHVHAPQPGRRGPVHVHGPDRLLLASFIGIFWQNDGLQFMISLVGVIVFTGLTAWDAQRLKAMALAVDGGMAGHTPSSAR